MVPSYGDGQATYEHRPSRHSDTPLSGSRSGQILWIRGLTRLQTQVRTLSCMFVFSHLIIHTIQHKIIRHDIFSTNESYLCQVNVSIVLVYDIEWIVSQTQSYIKRIRGTAC